MSIILTSPVTGGAQTGFTAPTYTLVADVAPDGNNGKQWAVSALGGTQAGVTAHSVSSPFTIMVSRPKVFKALGKPNPTTGVISNVPMNVHKWVIRKGVTPAAGQTYAIAMARIELSVPSGSDTYDAANVRALLSACIGSFSQQSAGNGDTLINGIL